MRTSAPRGSTPRRRPHTLIVPQHCVSCVLYAGLRGDLGRFACPTPSRTHAVGCPDAPRRELIVAVSVETGAAGPKQESPAGVVCVARLAGRLAQAGRGS